MPFTFAHPVAILPFMTNKKKYCNITALFVGSMAPDFEYFIHFIPYQLHGHTILGQLYYNLPLVIIVSYIYHMILKKPIIDNLPSPYCTYYGYMAHKEWGITSVRSFFVFVYSALLGMFTHLLWDSFTHRDGIFVTRWDVLNQHLQIMNLEIPIYKILQHGSTFIGFMILFIYLLRIQDKNGKHMQSLVSRNNKLLFWTSIFLIDIGIVCFLLIIHGFSISRMIVSFISGGFIGAVLVSIMVIQKKKTGIINN